MRTAKDVKKEIVRQYDKNPKDWRLHVGRDVRGHYDLAVAHGSTAWIIKEEQINPFKFVGFGAKTSRQNLEPLIEDIPNIFGIRSVSEKRMSELADALERKESVKDILTKIMKSNPVKSHESARAFFIRNIPKLFFIIFHPPLSCNSSSKLL